MTIYLTKRQVTQALVLVALSTIDLALTVILIVAEVGCEGNPVFSGLNITHIGLIKMLSLVMVIGICYYFNRFGIVTLLNKAMAVVVIWNLFLILITVGVSENG